MIRCSVNNCVYTFLWVTSASLTLKVVITELLNLELITYGRAKLER